MSGGPFSFQRSWEGFLPPSAVVMARRDRLTEISTEAAVMPSTNRVRFGFEAPDLADPSARELLDKILAALDLREDEFTVQVKLPESLAANVVVRFTAAENDAVGVWDDSCLTTFSLRAMLGNPGLKKPVWAHLKEAVVRSRRES